MSIKHRESAGLGGYVIYLRHGRTQYDQLQLERDHRALGTFDLARCDTRRQLSNEGREKLAQAGGQFRLANLPLDGACTSRYCRACGAGPRQPEAHRGAGVAAAVGQHCVGA
jgi:hypothetical protein